MTGVELVLSKLSDAKRNGQGWMATCPAHKDSKPSLSIGEGDDGCVLLYCYARCSTKTIVRLLGLKMCDLFPNNTGTDHTQAIGKGSDTESSSREYYQTAKEAFHAAARAARGKPVKYWPYQRADGSEAFVVWRFETPTGKTFRPITGSIEGWYIGDPEGPLPLYRLPELDGADCVFVCEGEKVVDAARVIGLVATTSAHGSQAPRKTDWAPLAGKEVVVLPDNDEAGRKYARTVSHILKDWNPPVMVKIVELPGLPQKGDLVDWLDNEGTVEKLETLIEATSPYKEIDQAQDVWIGGCRLGDQDPDTGRLILSPGYPLVSARVFVDEEFTPGGQRILICYGGKFFQWDGNCYRPMEEADLRARVYSFMQGTLRPEKGKKGFVYLAPFGPTKHRVGSIIDALESDTILPVSITPPAWLDRNENDPPAYELLVCNSSLLHLPTLRKLPPTFRLFVTSSLPIEYDPDAPMPKQWLKFLGELWPDDPGSIATLQQWFGYCLTVDTRQQKILMLIGPRRSGKGTIGRVLTGLLGEHNVVGPTTSSLVRPFGLQPLLGRNLAIVSDARFSGRSDQGEVVERLLCISGEDKLTIDRKHISAVTAKLVTRFMFLTNELPRLADTSGALAGRFIVLKLIRSFYGCEDLGLTKKLLEELPGILCWAIEGWQQLRHQGHFTQPQSGHEAVKELEDLGSPISAFLKECCEVGPEYSVATIELYKGWCTWCEEHGLKDPGTDACFGRDLMAALPSKNKRRLRGDDKKRHWFYQGLQLRI